MEQEVFTLQVNFDTETQTVGLGFNPQEYKTWEFVLAILEMARHKAEDAKRLAFMSAMQAQAQEEQIRRNLRRP